MEKAATGGTHAFKPFPFLLSSSSFPEETAPTSVTVSLLERHVSRCEWLTAPSNPNYSLPCQCPRWLCVVLQMRRIRIVCALSISLSLVFIYIHRFRSFVRSFLRSYSPPFSALFCCPTSCLFPQPRTPLPLRAAVECCWFSSPRSLFPIFLSLF